MKTNFFKKNKKQKSQMNTEFSEELTSKTDSFFSKDFSQIVNKIKSMYSFPQNIDFMARELTLPVIEKEAIIFYIPSLTDVKMIDEYVLQSLLHNTSETKEIPSIINVSAIKEEREINKAIQELNKGNTLLLVEEKAQAYIIQTATAASRSIEKPQNETTLFGPKESFIERADNNISLIRKKIHSADFTVEKMVIGERSHNEVYLVYNKELVGERVLNEVKARIGSIKKDSVQNLGLLVQHIEDRKVSLFPTILQTERPDRAASFIEDGYIVIIMNNSPFSLVTPATFWSFYHTADDHYLRFIYGNFTRFLRMLAIFITLFIPSIYIAITNFHIEMIPLDLLLAIAGAREMVPFPAILELLLMELSFELIREAGIRVPQPIGPTIGIVGALILGQAAVEANVVSPIVVIVVALTGLSSFAISDINLNYAIRITRFGFLLAASTLGILGMILVFMVGLFYLSTLKSFGVPYLAPLTPKYKSSGDTLFRTVLTSEHLRPSFLKTKDLTKDSVSKNENG